VKTNTFVQLMLLSNIDINPIAIEKIASGPDAGKYGYRYTLTIKQRGIDYENSSFSVCPVNRNCHSS
jgi:hypothetical protein